MIHALGAREPNGAHTMQIPSFVQLTCKQVTELVTEYMHGALGARERVRFEQHLHACTWCMTYLGQMRRTVACASQLSARNTQSPVVSLIELFRRSHRDRP